MTHEDTATDPSSHGVGTGWDLHCHTVFSDGTETPRRMVEQARQLGLEGLAITDHDTNAGWDQARQAARDLEMPLLPGTEITAQDGRVSVHMLAYLYDPKDPVIAGLFAKTRKARLTRTRTMVERISQDYPITWQDVLDQVKEGSKTTVGRPHIADALVKAGVYADRSQAFAGVCSSKSPYYLPTPSPTTHQVLEAVSHAGGVLIIAHPGAVSRNAVLLSDRQIAALAREGLGGLEVWHRDNPPEQRRRLLALAQRWGLLATGGSDWHGQGKPNRMGENSTSGEVVARIVDRAQGSRPVAWKN